MHIAIIIPAFNLAPFLRECLLSLLAQTHTNWSAVVVDDGSTDATCSVAAGFTDRRIRLIRQLHTGVSAARNTGIAAVQYPMENWARVPVGDTPGAFLFLDGDDWLAANALALLAATLEAAPCAVAACGRYARAALDGTTRIAAPPRGGCLLERLVIRNLFANGGHLLIRSEAIQVAGAFRGDLSYGEDWEYWARLAVLGEFVAVRSRAPLLFVRERPGSAYRSRATDPESYRPAIDAIHRNPEIAGRLGASRLAHLRHRADAETAWSVGRELIRHGNRTDGQRWLARSFRSAPNLKRLALIGLSGFGFGPFRLYQATG